AKPTGGGEFANHPRGLRRGDDLNRRDRNRRTLADLRVETPPAPARYHPGRHHMQRTPSFGSVGRKRRPRAQSNLGSLRSASSINGGVGAPNPAPPPQLFGHRTAD